MNENEEKEKCLENSMFIYRTIQCSISMFDLQRYTNMFQWQQLDPILHDVIVQNLSFIQVNENSKEFIVDCVLLLGYPLINRGKYDNNVMDMTKTYGVICVNPGYTIYEKNDKKGKIKKKIAEVDSYNFTTKKHKEYMFNKKIFVSEKNAIHYCQQNEDRIVNEIYGNNHSLLDEFVLNCSYAGNECEEHPDIGWINEMDKNIFDRTGEIKFVCKKCKKKMKERDKNFKVKRFTDNNVLNYKGEGIIKNLHHKNQKFLNDRMVDEEYFYFGKTIDMPFLSQYTNKFKHYFMKHQKCLCMDIETIQDQTIAISFIECIGFNKLQKSMYLTSKRPIANYEIDDDDNDEVRYYTNIPIDKSIYEAIKKKTKYTKIDINDEDNAHCFKTEVIEVENEQKIIEKFVEIIYKSRPVLLTHFNGTSFDMPELTDSYYVLTNKKGSLFNLLSFFNHKVCKPNVQTNSKDLQHDSFTAFIMVDIMFYHESTLDDAGSMALGVHKADVSYEEIPFLYEQRDSKLMIYAMWDVYITQLLWCHNKFLCFEIYIENQHICGLPWDLGSSNKKSYMAKLMSYSQEVNSNFISKMVNKPVYYAKQKAAEELVVYFLSGYKIRLDEDNEMTNQILTDFHAGNCKINTTFKTIFELVGNFYKNKYECIEMEEAMSIIINYFANHISSFKNFKTKELLSILYFMMMPPVSKIDLSHFQNYRDKFAFAYKEENLEKLDNFLIYLVTIRKYHNGLSIFENGEELLEIYLDYQKTDSKGEKIWLIDFVLKNMFYKRNSKLGDNEYIINEDFYKQVMSYNSFESRTFNKSYQMKNMKWFAREMIKNITQKTKSFQLDNLPFSGSHIFKPKTGINISYVVSILDFTGEYPNVMRWKNLGSNTRLSYDYVKHHKLIDGEHFLTGNVRRCDDFISYTDYEDLAIKAGGVHTKEGKYYIDYIKENYQFFVCEHQYKSDFIIEYETLINDRLGHKNAAIRLGALCEAETDPIKKAELEIKWKNEENKSTSKKSIVNSAYGLLDKFLTAAVRPIVTAGGRVCTKLISIHMRENFGDKVVIQYGDTDSVMLYFDISVSKLIDESNEEIEKYFASPIVTKEHIEKSRKKAIEFELKKRKNEIFDPIVYVCKFLEDLYNNTIAHFINDRMPCKYMTLSVENVLFPYVLSSAKMYVGTLPCNDYKKIVNGLSIKNKNATLMTKKILGEFLKLLNERITFPLICFKLYTFLGNEVIKPLLSGNIDYSLIQKKISIDKMKAETAAKNSKISQLKKKQQTLKSIGQNDECANLNENDFESRIKKHNILERLKSEGELMSFDKVKLKVIPVKPIGNDIDWSFATLKQIETHNYELCIPKILLDNLTEIINILSTQFNTDIIYVFDILKAGIFNSKFSLEWFEKKISSNDTPSNHSNEFKFMNFNQINKLMVQNKNDGLLSKLFQKNDDTNYNRINSMFISKKMSEEKMKKNNNKRKIGESEFIATNLSKFITKKKKYE